MKVIHDDQAQTPRVKFKDIKVGQIWSHNQSHTDTKFLRINDVHMAGSDIYRTSLNLQNNYLVHTDPDATGYVWDSCLNLSERPIAP